MNGPTALRVRQPGDGARLIAFQSGLLPNPHLIGHCSVDFSGWVVHRIPVFRKADGSLSVGGPTAAEVDGDGRQRERAARVVS
jgi:hypothetical protein